MNMNKNKTVKTMKKTAYTVTVRFCKEAMNDEAAVGTPYSFRTQHEVDAFLEGVAEAIDWNDYSVETD